MKCYASETDAVVNGISDHLEGFNLAELRVILFVAQRLAKGRRQYGPLNPADTSKDWMQEFDEELVDALVYRAAQRLRERSDNELIEKIEELPERAAPCPECNGTGWKDRYCGWCDCGHSVRCECQREEGGEGC